MTKIDFDGYQLVFGTKPFLAGTTPSDFYGANIQPSILGLNTRILAPYNILTLL